MGAQAAIYYVPEGYKTTGPKLMGRNAAGESFLRGYFRYNTGEAYWAFLERQNDGSEFVQTMQHYTQPKPTHFISDKTLHLLEKPGTLYTPGPGLAGDSRKRSFYGHARWSVSGITHTTSSDRAMDGLIDMLVAPVQPWDTLICTSIAVRDHVRALLDTQTAYLTGRFKAAIAPVRPLLPVIPLGIHCEDFAFTPAQKAQAREALGADAETLVVLFVGRLAFHAKAHPLPMYAALGKAARESGKKLMLVECGWHANDYLKQAFVDGAAALCPEVAHVLLDGRKAEDRQTAWAGADIFCSLSDNIQETFGITPIEAMAAGLPVVVSDWDGYKDTVRDGIDGFRIPTTMPAVGLSYDLALRHAVGIDTYDMYCGYTCSMVAVDVQATTLALLELIRSPEKRARMGAAGRARAQEIFDWQKIIPRYEAVWAEQNALREKDGAGMVKGAHGLSWPARPDPFGSFAHYPTYILRPETQLAPCTPDLETALQEYAMLSALTLVTFAHHMLPTAQEAQAVLTVAAQGARPAGDLVAGIAPERRGLVFRALTHFMKLGLLRLA